ncbi:MAG: ATP-binding cassette domain-containing protein [Phycisphaerales bacterium]
MSPPTAGPDSPLLETRGLCVDLPGRSSSWWRAAPPRRIVESVSLTLARGRTLAVVGESGSGKSTLARAVLRLVPLAAGDVLLEGRSLGSLSAAELRSARSRMQVIFQDPASAMNPRHQVEEIVTEPLIVHERGMSRQRRRDAAAALLERCGMPADSLDRYPHQFSGGQRQRIAVARALMLSPSLIVCDEPTSALDVSVRAQIINLLADLQRERGISYLLISHDMATVRQLADEVLVLKSGRVVEQGPADRVLSAPEDEYTKELLAAVARWVPLAG